VIDAPIDVILLAIGRHLNPSTLLTEFVPLPALQEGPEVAKVEKSAK
jgi:hypothetical protein